MIMRRNLSCTIASLCITLLLVGLVVPTPACAGSRKVSASSSWHNVLALKKGDEVIVTLFSQRILQGKLVKADAESVEISLSKKAGSTLVARGDIQSLALFERRKANIAGGLIMSGGAALAATSQLVSSSKTAACLSGVSTLPGLNSCGNGRNMPMLYAGFGAAAAGVGVMVLMGKPKFIYESDSPANSSNDSR